MKQQNLDILLSSDNKNANYQKTFVLNKKIVEKNKFPLLNDMNLKDRKDGLDDKNNHDHDIK